MSTLNYQGRAWVYTCATLLFLHNLLFVQSIFAQGIGGRNNQQGTPRTVSASELSNGSFNGSVNNFTGTYGSRYGLGKVSTVSGLSFELNMNYSASATTGGNVQVTNGIPYGEG